MMHTEGIDRQAGIVGAHAEIERTRAQLSQSMQALQLAIKKEADWREWVRQRPALFVTAALVLGFACGRGLFSRQRRRGK